MKSYKMKAVALAFTAIFFTATWAQAATDNVVVPTTLTVAAATLDLTLVSNLDFGSIILGTNLTNTLEIDAGAGAVVGTTLAGTGTSVASGGASGLVTVATNVDSNATIGYAIASTNTPANGENLDIFSGDTDDLIPLTSASIVANSTGPSIQLTAAGPNQVHIGGLITVNNSTVLTTGAYGANITVTVTHQ